MQQVAVAGLPEVTIGETLADPDDPRPLPVITVDEPSLSMEIGINTSPLAGRDGKLLTARQVRARLEQELIGNVSIRVRDTERPDAWEGPRATRSNSCPRRRGRASRSGPRRPRRRPPCGGGSP